MTLDDCPGPGHQGDTDDHLSPVSGVDAADRRPVFRAWRNAITTSKRESQARRARVLAHEDLAQRLTHPPLSLSTPQRWSGVGIPSRTLPEESCAQLRARR